MIRHDIGIVGESDREIYSSVPIYLSFIVGTAGLLVETVCHFIKEIK